MVTRSVFLMIGVAATALLAACSSDATTEQPRPTSTTPATPVSTPAGPRVVVEPASGPPGVEITIRGSGWEPGVMVDLTGRLAPGVTAEPYETVVSNADGSFTARFRLESAPDGSSLSTGRYDLIARSTASEVTIPFLVQSPRPITSTGGGPG